MNGGTVKITRLLVVRIIFGILLILSAYIWVRDFRPIPSPNKSDQIPALLTIPVIWVNAVLWLEPKFSAVILGDKDIQ
jgi:hypothetical protein